MARSPAVSAGAGGESQLAAAIVGKFGRAVILYDGECPVCGEYLSLLKIRERAGEVALVNARNRPDLVAGLRAVGYEINDGIVLAHDGSLLYGASALSLIAQLDGTGRRVNRLSAALFRAPLAGEAVYVLLKAARRLLLRLLGRDPI